jgi:hypothetical protein
MDAILIALVVTMPVIALITGVYLWGRQHSTPDFMRYRVLQAALLVVLAAGLAYFILSLLNRDGRMRGAPGLASLGGVLAFLGNELRRVRRRLK